jgi:hypothetical protein
VTHLAHREDPECEHLDHPAGALNTWLIRANSLSGKRVPAEVWTPTGQPNAFTDSIGQLHPRYRSH